MLHQWRRASRREWIISRENGLSNKGFSELKLEEQPSSGILADTLVGFSLGAGSGSINIKRFIQNHEAAWNICFADGAVKTFADGGHNLRRVLMEGTVMDEGPSETAAGRGPSAEFLKTYVFDAYFDAMCYGNYKETRERDNPRWRSVGVMFPSSRTTNRCLPNVGRRRFRSAQGRKT